MRKVSIKVLLLVLAAAMVLPGLPAVAAFADEAASAPEDEALVTTAEEGEAEKDNLFSTDDNALPGEEQADDEANPSEAAPSSVDDDKATVATEDDEDLLASIEGENNAEPSTQDAAEPSTEDLLAIEDEQANLEEEVGAAKKKLSLGSWLTIYEYAGVPVEPEFSGLKGLTRGVDYQLVCENNDGPGEARATVMGLGSYTGTTTIKYTITKGKISNAKITNIHDEMYTGEKITPKPKVVMSGTTLIEGQDYELSYTNNKNVGLGLVTVKGIGNFKGSKAEFFNIKPIKLDNCIVERVEKWYPYTGSQVKPVPIVRWQGKKLKADVAYTVSYGVNTQVGTGYVYIKAESANFTGGQTIRFKIYAANIARATVSEIPGQIYTGHEIRPRVIIRFGETLLKNNVDYKLDFENNVKVGTATVTITGLGNFSETTTTTFTIAKQSIKDLTVPRPSPRTYTGSQIKPLPTVTIGKTTLVNNVDYELSYQNNVNAGIATVVITGKGIYTGTTSTTFTILEADISKTSMAWRNPTKFTGTPAAFASFGASYYSKALVEGKDYTITYENNDQPGKATAIVTGIGNFKGTWKHGFTVPKASLSAATVSVASTRSYTGKAVKPRPTVQLYGKTLVLNEDYIVTFEDNVKVGTAKVNIKAKSDSTYCTGSTTQTFTIIGQLSDAVITTVANQKYTGKKITPKLVVNTYGRVLTSGTDYKATYTKNVNVGTATVTIEGLGNYRGTNSITFKIVPASISKLSFEKPANQTYTGNALKPDLTISHGSKRLTLGTDYTLSYKNNVNAGTAKITATGIGNYTGTIATTFVIVQADISTATIETVLTYDAFTGKPEFYVPILTYNGKTLAIGTDYTFLPQYDYFGPNTLYVYISGIGNYCGENEDVLRYEKIDVNDTAIEFDVDTYDRTGFLLKPKVWYCSQDLVEGRDYDCEINYESLDAFHDHAWVIITGKGRFTGVYEEHFFRKTT